MKLTNVVYQDPDYISTRINFIEFPTLFIPYVFFPPFTMSVIIQKAKIILAIEVIRISKRLSCRKVAKLYQIPFFIFNGRMNGRITLFEQRPASVKLSNFEEEVIIWNIFDMDSKGFALRLAGVENMTNYIFKSREGKCIGKLWVYRFV